MPLFYVHIRSSDGFIADEEGTDLPDSGYVLAEAEKSARDLLSAFVKAGKVVDHQGFEVMDEAGKVVLTYPFGRAPAFPVMPIA